MEVLMVAMLVMLTLIVAFEFQNQSVLRDILLTMQRNQIAAPGTLAAAPPAAPPAAPTPTSTPATATPSAAAASTPAVSDTPAVPAPVSTPIAPATAPAAAAAAPAATSASVPAAAAQAPLAPAPSPRTQPAAAASSASTAAADPAALSEDSPEWQQHGPVVTQIIQDLMGGNYDAVVTRFNSEMAATGLNRAQLAGAIDPIRKEHGGYSKLLHFRTPTGRLPSGMNAFEVGVELADRHQLLLTITLDAQQRIAGLLMK
jgi:hypothetical protein